jgi:hypothetical protein
VREGAIDRLAHETGDGNIATVRRALRLPNTNHRATFGH